MKRRNIPILVAYQVFFTNLFELKLLIFSLIPKDNNDTKIKLKGNFF